MLDRDFPGIVSPVMKRMREELRALSRRQPATSASAAALAAAAAGSAPPERTFLCQLATIVYRTTKLRGYKAIIKLFPHAVADIEPVIDCMIAMVRRSR